MKKNKKTLFHRSKKAVSHTEDDKVFILDESQERIITLNKTGKLLWQALKTPQTADNLQLKLLQSFTVSDNVAKKDVQNFLRQMMKLGLVI